MTTPIDVLCRGYPSEFAAYLNYCRALTFEEKPDYMYLRRLFRDLFYKMGYEPDFAYDWTIKNLQMQQSRERVPKQIDDEKQAQKAAAVAATTTANATATEANRIPPTPQTPNPNAENRAERLKDIPSDPNFKLNATHMRSPSPDRAQEQKQPTKQVPPQAKTPSAPSSRKKKTTEYG